MKKSEAIDAITKILDDRANELDESTFFNDSLAKTILNTLEDMGMKPYYEGLMATGEKFNKELHQGRDTMMIRNWEPE